MNQPDRTAPAWRAAARLAALAGLGRVETLRMLTAGRNNQGYALQTSDGVRSFLKIYFSHPGDSRDRLGAESAFAQFARTAGETRGPLILAVCREENAVLFERIEGRQPRPEEIGKELILEAADFFVALNRPCAVQQASGLPEASEACFSIREHLRVVEARVARLAQVPQNDGPSKALARFMAQELLPVWARVRERVGLLAAAQDATDAAWQCSCLSPSDFGFHNALLEPGGAIRFLDFEYAGRDDPAKTVCDFFLQPAVPAPWEHARAFTRRIAEALCAGPRLADRARLVFPVYGVKWACILLNAFLRVDALRRSFSGSDESSDQGRMRQLEKARTLLLTLETSDFEL